MFDVCCRRGATTLPLPLKYSKGWRLPPHLSTLAHARHVRYNVSSLLLLTDDDDVKEEARVWARQQVVRAPAASSFFAPLQLLLLSSHPCSFFFFLRPHGREPLIRMVCSHPPSR